MKISPLAKLGMLGTFAAGTALSAVLIGSAHHTSTPTQIVVRQDAVTGAVTSSAAPVKHAAPKPAAATSTVVNQQPAAVQEAPVVTDPTTASAPAPAASDSASIFFQPVTEKPGPGNAPSSTSGNSIPTATADPSPSN